MKRHMWVAAIPVLTVVLWGQTAEFATAKRTISGKEVTYQWKAFHPPIALKADSARLNQTTAANCSFLLYTRLAKGDVDGAAQLSSAPGKTKAKYTQYKERLGAAEFQKMFTEYFNGKGAIKYEFVIGDHHMLLLTSPEGDGELSAQMYVKTGDKYLVDESESPQFDQLGRLFSAVREGTLKLPE